MTKLFGPTHYTEEDLANEGFKSLGRNVRIAKTCTIIGAENISIGDNIRIDGYCTLTATGCGFIHFGSYIHVGGNCVLLAGEGITFENFSCLSWGVKLFTHSDDFSGKFMTNPTVPSKYTGVTGGPIVLKRHVVVGPGSVVLPKVTLGEGVAVGALSLVTKSLAEWGIYGGIPVKHIKTRKKQLLEMESFFLEEIGQPATSERQETAPIS